MALDPNQKYKDDYDSFWKNWYSRSESFERCDSIESVKSFLHLAVATQGNAEVSQANSEVIEKLAINNPECIANAMNQLEDDSLIDFMFSYIFYPVYTKFSDIDASLSKVLKKDKYNRIMNEYSEIKKRFELRDKRS